jgi:hypothetical protein
MSANANIESPSFITHLKKIGDAKSYFSNLKLAKRRLTFYRWKIAEELDKQLLEFESSVKRTGGIVHWGNDADEARTIAMSFTDMNDRVAFLPERLCNEIGLSNKANVSSLSHFMQKNEAQFPDTLFVQAKFLISTSGHIYFGTDQKESFEAVNNAKNLVFLAGVDSLLTNGNELELAKNLYSIYELGNFGFPLEILTKPVKPENKYGQSVYVIIIDNGRSNLLQNDSFRKFFPLLNFELPQAVSDVFWPETIENQQRFGTLLENLITPLMENADGTKDFFFNRPIFNRLVDFLPYELNIYDTFIRAREKHADSIKNSLVRKFFKHDNSKYFLNELPKLNSKKFTSIVKEMLTGEHKHPHMPEKNFVEQHYYNKRKI